MAVNILMFALMESTVLLIGFMGIPMWRRSVAPNPKFGFRTRLTLENPRIWYEVNARSGRDMSILGFAMSPLAAPLLFLGPGAMIWFLIGYALVLGLGLAALTVKAAKLAQSLYDQGWGEDDTPGTKPKPR